MLINPLKNSEQRWGKECALQIVHPQNDCIVDRMAPSCLSLRQWPWDPDRSQIQRAAVEQPKIQYTSAMLLIPSTQCPMP